MNRRSSSRLLHALALSALGVIAIAVPAVAQSQISWQQWARQNPTYRYLRPPLKQPTAGSTITDFNSSWQPTLQGSFQTNLNAFLRVIRYAEGTSSADGYHMMFTARRFSSFADHPRQMNCSRFQGRSLCSTAAGAYQFLDTTWDSLAPTIGARDFRPAWQDRAAIELIRRAGALTDIQTGNVEQAIAKTANIWASFPRWSGDSGGAYNQAVKPMHQLVHAYYFYQQP
jgi:muramidase (phage lysozyme)